MSPHIDGCDAWFDVPAQPGPETMWVRAWCRLNGKAACFAAPMVADSVAQAVEGARQLLAMTEPRPDGVVLAEVPR